MSRARGRGLEEKSGPQAKLELTAPKSGSKVCVLCPMGAMAHTAALHQRMTAVNLKMLRVA